MLGIMIWSKKSQNQTVFGMKKLFGSLDIKIKTAIIFIFLIQD